MKPVPSLQGGTALSRHIISLSHEHLTAFDLDACVHHADARNQRHRETFTTPCPTASSRWLSHSQCPPRPIALTTEGEGEGGLRWLVGATLDWRFTRAICAPHDAPRGGSCYDPASLVVLAGAATGDQDVDSARCCDDLHHAEKGRRSRALAGLHDAIPGEEDRCHCRSRVGAEAIDKTIAAVVELCRNVGLSTGERLSTDGQLAPSQARSQGWTDAGEGCRSFRVDETSHQDLCRQWHRGAQRLPLPGPFPEVVDQVRQATAKQGRPTAPTGALLGIEAIPDGQASGPDRPQSATLLGLPEDAGPAVRLPWCHVRQGPQGAWLGRCPQVPSDLEAKGGDHLETTDPSKQEPVWGSRHQKTTESHQALGLEVPVGTSTDPAKANEGPPCIDQRAALAMPVLPGQVPLGDAASDVSAHSQWRRDRGGIAVVASTPRHADLSPEALVERGDDPNGTPSAPGGRPCRSHGDDSQATSRHSVGGRPCPPEEQQRCPHAYGVRGSRHRMTCTDHPRLIGPIPRGTAAWPRLSAARPASERTNSDDQEVIANGRPLRMRGLEALRCAGAIRTLAQLLRRALHCVRDVTSTLGETAWAQACETRFFANTLMTCSNQPSLWGSEARCVSIPSPTPAFSNN